MSTNIARAASVTIVLFTALTLTHAAFVDYRSTGGDKSLGQMPYLQNRKFGVETSSLSFERDSWRGQVRQKWTGCGMCCSVYELLVRMKGGPTRVRLLALLAAMPKNKLQLANESGIDWKAVDRHVERMLEFGLVQVVATAGTCTIYAITEKGARALALVVDCKELG
jgi:predicted transcriptional regulator